MVIMTIIIRIITNIIMSKVTFVSQFWELFQVIYYRYILQRPLLRFVPSYLAQL